MKNQLTLKLIQGKTQSNQELYHHGILGMKWGVRRYQNKDGTLTSAGRKRYGSEDTRKAKGYRNLLNDLDEESLKYISEGNKATNKAAQLSKKRENLMTKDHVKNFDKKLSKLDRRIEEQKAKANKSYESSKKVDSETFKVIAKALSKGYDITSKPTQRVVDEGKYYLAGLFLGPIVSAPLMNVMDGKSYAVKKSSNDRGQGEWLDEVQKGVYIGTRLNK